MNAETVPEAGNEDRQAAQTAASPRRNRSKGILVLALAIAAAIGLAAATQEWLIIQLSPGAAALSDLAVTGQKLNPSLSPLAIALLAVALVLTIAGRVFRRILGLVAALLGVGLGSIAWMVVQEPATSAAGAIAEVTGIAGTAQLELVRSIDPSLWPILTIIASVIAIIAGVAVLLVSGNWKTGGRRFETAGARNARYAQQAPVGEPDRIAEWDALSGGEDPSLDDSKE